MLRQLRCTTGWCLLFVLACASPAWTQPDEVYENFPAADFHENVPPLVPAPQSLQGQQDVPYVDPQQPLQPLPDEQPYYEYEDPGVEELPPLPPVAPPIITPRSTRPIEPGTRPARPIAPPSPRDALPTRRPGAAVPPAEPRPEGAPVTGHPMASPDKTGATPAEPVSFDFLDAPLYDVVASISRLTGRNFDLDPNLSATTVTIITHDEIPPEMAFEVLESILASRGYSMVESVDGHLIKIMPTPEVTASEKKPLFLEGREAPEGFDGFSTHLVTVKHGDAAEIQRVLQILGSKNAQVDVYAPTNTLIITDTADGIRRMFAFLETADVPGFDTAMEIFTLEFTRADVLANQISQVLMVDAPQAGPLRPGMPPQPQMPPAPVRPVRAARPAAAAPAAQVIGTREEVLRMVPDERLNALIVVATEGMMARVRDLVKRLDTPTPHEANNMHIYQLLNADAESVEAAIQPLIGTAPRRQAGPGAGGAAGPGGPIAGGGMGAGPIPEVQPFEQRVQVIRYDRTNSLLIVASPQDYKLLESFIARLDVPQRQVAVDAVVMDVTMGNDYGLTVDAASIAGFDAFGLTSTATISELLNTVHTAEEIVGGPRAALRSAVMGLGTGGGLTMGVYDDLSFTWQGREIKIPFVPVLFQAMEKITDVEVLSQPSLVTLDNEEASIVVGQEVPFITGTSAARRPDGQADAGFYGGFTRVERHEVGVKLKVTPQISEGDNVMLQVDIEISDTDATQIGTVDIVGPTTNKSLVTNKTLVRDGSTAVIAGLIRDNLIRDRTQAPILGDLPLIGWMFGSKADRREKRNMVVLVTPYIIKEGMDMERITHQKINEYHDANVEEIFHSGFFDKVFRKYDRRKHYRPTLQRSEALSGRAPASNRFRRGDIER